VAHGVQKPLEAVPVGRFWMLLAEAIYSILLTSFFKAEMLTLSHSSIHQ